jgi:hypothetical protein
MFGNSNGSFRVGIVANGKGIGPRNNDVQKGMPVMIRISSNGQETQAIAQNTCVRMGAVAIRIACGKCGKSAVGILLADRPGYVAIECGHCGHSADALIGS